jgi:cation:H+ antiporter
MMASSGLVVQVGLLVATVVGLWIGARLLVDSVVRLARQFGLSELTIGLTVVAVGTSLPELVVTTDAALKGFGDIAVGNVLGSNIYNLAFILGVISLVRVLPIEWSLVHRDGVVLVVSTLVGAAVLFDLSLSRLEAAGLLVLFFAYTGYLLRNGTDSVEPADAQSKSGNPSGFHGRDTVALVAGGALVLVSGDLLVAAASSLARGVGISEWVIGGTIVAAGTSTPEFAVSLVALRSGRLGVSVGNIVGSNVFNMLAVLGVAGLLRPLALDGAVITSLGWLTVVVVVLVAALWTGRRLSRLEGGLFALSELARWAVGLLG